MDVAGKQAKLKLFIKDGSGDATTPGNATVRFNRA